MDFPVYNNTYEYMEAPKETYYSRNRNTPSDYDYKSTSKYKEEMEQESREIERLFSLYFSMPARHPRYLEEWNKFWDVRSAQLFKIGLNPKYIDLTDEWRDFFLSRLKLMKEAEYEEVESKLYNKFTGNQEKRDSNRKKSRRQRRSRSSSSSSSCVSSGSKQKNSKSSEKKQKLSNTEKKPSIVAVCRELLKLDSLVVINRTKVNDLLTKAFLHERTNHCEYWMNKEECNFLKILVDILRNTLIIKKLSRYTFDETMSILTRLEHLIVNWENFMREEMKTSDDLFYDNSKNVDSPRAKKEQKESVLSIQKSNSINSDIVFNRLEYFGKNIVHHGGQSNALIKSEPEEKLCVKIKQEEKETKVIQQSVYELMLEKQELLKKLHGDNASSSTCADENENDSMQINNMISDEELITYLKDLENLSESQQGWLLQIMTNIEDNDETRFNRLKEYIFKEDDE